MLQPVLASGKCQNPPKYDVILLYYRIWPNQLLLLFRPRLRSLPLILATNNEFLDDSVYLFTAILGWRPIWRRNLFWLYYYLVPNGT